MSEKKDWISEVLYKKLSDFVAMVGDQLSRKDFNDIVAGRKVLKAFGHPAVGSIKTKPPIIVDYDPPIAIPYKEMLEIAGKRRYQLIATKETISDLFGIGINKFPPIMIRRWEFQRYVDSVFPHFFIYWPGGMSMKEIYEKLILRYGGRRWGKVLYDTDRYGGGKESFFTDPIQSGWMMHSLQPIPNTGGENFLRHTQMHRDFICNQIYKETVLPMEVKEAVREFNKAKYNRINFLIEGNEWQEGAIILAGLKINQMFCSPSPAVGLLFSAATREQIGQNIFENLWSWTRALSRDGNPIFFGGSDASGIRVGGARPSHSAEGTQRFSFRWFPAATAA
ncbi:MAG: hypothetical protein PHU42_00375 [Patescibacteria group bacterium]|nr:hypothetical protein [Patescibacteria group bacterium]